MKEEIKISKILGKPYAFQTPRGEKKSPDALPSAAPAPLLSRYLQFTSSHKSLIKIRGSQCS